MDYNKLDLGGERRGSPIFYELLSEMAETHDSKSHDYANSNNPFGNYEFAGILAGMFSHSSIDAGFVGRLGEKIYRLHVLESGGKIPLNESIADTERDIAVIATLWMAARKEKRLKNQYVGESSLDMKEAATEQSSPAAAPGYLKSRIDREMSRNEKLDLIIHLIKTTTA